MGFDHKRAQTSEQCASHLRMGVFYIFRGWIWDESVKTECDHQPVQNRLKTSWQVISSVKHLQQCTTRGWQRCISAKGWIYHKESRSETGITRQCN